MYVKRDAAGNIALVSAHADDDCSEFVTAGDPELLAFIDGSSGAFSERRLMRESDLDFVRVLEDVIAVLIDKSVIRFTDLPQEAQRKLSERHFMRDHIHSVGLLDESEDDDDGVI